MGTIIACLLLAFMVFGGKYVLLIITILLRDKEGLHDCGNLCQDEDPRKRWQAWYEDQEWRRRQAGKRYDDIY